MKYIYLLAIAFLLGIGAGGGFVAGELWQTRLDQKAAVEANAAYWNMRTREFTYGNPDAVNVVNTRVTELLEQDSRIPARKPKQSGR
jgi:hypothetical protein